MHMYTYTLYTCTGVERKIPQSYQSQDTVNLKTNMKGLLERKYAGYPDKRQSYTHVQLLVWI